MDNVTIVIEQLQPSQLVGDRQVWEVEVSIFDGTMKDTAVHHWEAIISDPFNQETHESVARYLNDLLSAPSLAKHSRLIEMVPIEVKRYQETLMDCLKLRNCSAVPNAETLSQRPVKIEILTKASFIANSTTTSSSLQYLHWELLEGEDLLSFIKIKAPDVFLRPLSVRVRRQIGGEEGISGNQTRIRANEIINSVGHQNLVTETFKVLVVVARDMSKKPDPWSPTIVPAALLRVQEAYLELGFRQRIIIKVARPGSLRRFEQILQSDTFNVVHFDVHGGRSTPEHGAQLQFNVHDNLEQEWVDGAAVAQTINRVGGGNRFCVIIGACQTARADAASHANLAATFVRAGVANVLAMSYKMCDTMSQKFFDTFYDELFVHHQEFSEAARLARRRLFQDRERTYYTYYKGRSSVKITDWFIPVVYSNGISFLVEDRGISRSASKLNESVKFVGSDLSLSVLGIGGAAIMQSSYPHYWTPLLSGAVLVSLLYLRYLSRRWLKAKLEKRKSFEDALQASMNDKDNIIRLEHDLHRARSVFFNSYFQPQDARQLLKNLLKIWERTFLVDGVLMLDSQCFLKRTSWKRVYGQWRIYIWRLTSTHLQDYEPHLIVVIENVHHLYSDEHNEGQFDGKLNLETWVRSSFKADPKSLNPYLIMVGRAPVNGHVSSSTRKTSEWVENNFKSMEALENMAAHVFQTTDWLSYNKSARPY